MYVHTSYIVRKAMKIGVQFFDGCGVLSFINLQACENINFKQQQQSFSKSRGKN